MAHPVLSAFRDLEIDPRDDARARAFGAALDAVAPEGLDALPAERAEGTRALLREFVKSALARWDDALVVRVLDEWLPREASLDARLRLLIDRAVVTAEASLEEARVVEAWQAALAMAKKASDAAAVARAEEALAARKERKATWSKRSEAFRAAAAASDGAERARALAAAAEEALRFGKAGRKKSSGLVEANAEADLQRAFDLDPANAGVARLLVNLFDARRRLEDRTRVIRRHEASAAEDERRAAAVRVAYALCRERKFEAALEAFRAAGVLDVGDVLALDRFAACAIAVDDLDLSSSALEALVDRSSFPSVTIEALAGVLHVVGSRRGRVDLAMPFAERLRVLAPEHEALRVVEAGGQAEATAPLASEPRVDDVREPEAPAAHEAVPVATAAPAPVDEPLAPRELEALRVRLRQNPTDDGARARLKAHYRAQGPAAALVELVRYELAQARAPEDRRAALVELCAVHRSVARNDAALIGTLSQLVALEPLDREAAEELGGLLEKHGRWRDALVVLGKLAESETEPVRKLAASRGLARRWSAQMAQAPQVAEAWEKVLALEPGDSEAFGALRDILAKRHAHGPLAALLEARAGHARAVEERHALLLEAAKLFAERLGRAEDAIAQLRRILAENPAQLGAIEALERIADSRRDYALLAEVMEARLGFTQDENLKLTALQRLAALYGERLQDPLRALATWRRVLELSPSHSRAARAVRDALIASGDIDELERTYAASGDHDGFVATLVAASERESDLARRYELVERAARVLAARHPSGEAVVRLYERLLALDPKRLEPARALVAMHEAEKRYGRLGSLYEALLADEAEPTARVAWLEKLVELYLDRVPDAARAWRFALDRFRAAGVSSPSVGALEHAAKRTGRWTEFAEVLGTARLEAPSMDAVLRAKIATVQAQELGAVDDAIATLDSLWSDGADVFRDLERLLRAHGRVDPLRAAFARRIAESSDADALALAGELALLEEEVFGDVVRAEEAHRSIVARAPDHLPSLRALVRFAEARGDDVELARRLEVLASAVDDTERAGVRARRARLLAARDEGHEAAWAELELALEGGLPPANAVEVLETLAQGVPVRERALGRLAAICEAIVRPLDAAFAYERLASVASSAAARSTAISRRAEILFTTGNDPATAVALAASLVREQPGSATAWHAFRRYDVSAAEAAGVYVSAAREALSAHGSTMAADLRAELAEHVAEALERDGDRFEAFAFWLLVLDASPTHEPARERGLATSMCEGAGAERVDRFFRLAFGAAPGERTLANWASALRIQGAHAAAAARLEARLELVGASDEVLIDLADCHEAAGAYERLAEVLKVHAAATTSDEVRARKTAQRIALLVERLDDRRLATEEVLIALGALPGDAALEALAARLADGEPSVDLWRALASSAEQAGRSVDVAHWLERLAFAPTDAIDAAERESALRRGLGIDAVEADDARSERLLCALVELAPDDEVLRERWITVLRRLGRPHEFVDAMERAFTRASTPASRSGLLRAADLASSVLDDASHACTLFARVRDDASCAVGDRVDASRRGLLVARLALGRQALLAALDAHAALELADDERATTLEEAARVSDALVIGDAERLERWRLVVAADAGHLEARRHVVDLAERSERFELAIAELDELALRLADGDEVAACVLRSARMSFARLDRADDALRSLEGLGRDGDARRDVQELRLEVAGSAGRGESAVAALRALVALESDPVARSSRRVELARRLAADDVTAMEAIGVAELALDEVPGSEAAAGVLRELLDREATRARAAEVLVERFGSGGDSPGLLVVALVARAACTGDDASACEHLSQAVRVAEDILGDGARAYAIALTAVGRCTTTTARRIVEDASRLGRALGDHVSLVREVDARIGAVTGPVRGELVAVALDVGERIGAEPSTLLAWCDAAVAEVGASLDLLERRLGFARATGSPVVVLEALDRIDAFRVARTDRFALEVERMRMLDAIEGRADEALEAAFRALEQHIDLSVVTDVRGRLAERRASADMLRLEEFVRAEPSLAVGDRIGSLLSSFEASAIWAGDAAQGCAYLAEALGANAADRRIGPALRRLLSLSGLEAAVRLDAARALERASRVGDDKDGVVEALEAVRQVDPEDSVVVEALAEARLARGDAPGSIAPLWVHLLSREPGHRRAFGALAALEDSGERLRAAQAVAEWLAALSFDDDETAALCEFVALEFVAAGLREAARSFMLRAFRANPSARAERFALLDELLADAGDNATRVDLHRERAQESLDVAERFERLLVLADLEEQRDGDARAARATYEEALEVGDFDLTAVAALERVYALQGDWRALFDLLSRRLERTPSADERSRVRARMCAVALERLESPEEAADAVVAWLQDAGVDERARREACAYVERLLEIDAVRGRIAEECEALLQLSDGRTRSRALEAAAELEPTRADAARRWFALARHETERGVDGAAAVRALARAFAGEPASTELRSIARSLADRLVDWSEIARAFEATLADLEPWERRDAVLSIVSILDEEAGDPRAALALLDAAAAEPDADDALHVKADELSMILADWRGNVRALRRRASASLDAEVRADCLRRAAAVAEEELAEPVLALDIARELLADADDADDLTRALRLARAANDRASLRRFLPRHLDASGWGGEFAEPDALELAELMSAAGESVDDVLELLGRALDAGLPRPRLASMRLEVLRTSGRSDELARALEEEAERSVDPGTAASAWDERSLVCSDALGDADGAFVAAKRACEALPSDARFARLVATAQADAGLLEEALAYVESASGPGREAAEWSLLEAALAAFEGDARLAVSRRLGERAWAAGRGAVAADAWLVALALDPLDDPFASRLEERLDSFGPAFLSRYADVLGTIARDALDPHVQSTAALRRGELLVERLDQAPLAIESLRAADRSGADPERVADLLVRALEGTGPREEFAAALERSASFASGEKRARLIARAARVLAELGAESSAVVERAALALEASDDAAPLVEDLLFGALDSREAFGRAAELLEPMYRARGDHGARIALKRKALVHCDQVGDRIAALLELARTIEDLDGSAEAALAALLDAATLDVYDDEVFVAFLTTMKRKPSVNAALPKVLDGLRDAQGARAGWVRFALALHDGATDVAPATRLELLRAVVDADPENGDGVAALEAALLAEPAGPELVRVLVHRARLELEPARRAGSLRRAFELASETLMNAALVEEVFVAWSELDEGQELFACRIAVAEKGGDHAEALAWSRRAAEECFDPDRQGESWRAHLDRAERAAAWDEALRALERLLASDPADVALQGRQRGALRASGDAEGLARAYDDHAMAVEDDDARVELMLELAAHIERGLQDAGRAREVLRRALDVGRREASVIEASRALAARSRDDAWFVEMLDAASDAAAGRGDDRAIVGSLVEAAAILEERLGDAAGALERFERARALDSSREDVTSHVVRLARQLGRWELAVDVLEERVARDPSRGSFADLVATADASREGWLLDRALDAWRRLGFDAPDLEDELYAALLRDERLEEAYAFLRERTERLRGAGRTDDAAGLVQRALDRGGSARPIELLELAVQIRPDDAAACFELAGRFEEEGRGDDARDVIESVIPMIGDAERLAFAYSRLGRIARGQWDLERARRHFAKAYEVLPSSALALRDLASTTQELGASAEAFVHWKALLLLPLDETTEVRRSDALVGLARLYEDEGDRAKAAELYAHALAAAPGHDEAARGAARTR